MKVKKGRRGTLGVKGWRGEKKRLEEEEDKGLRNEKEKETMCRETMKKQSHTPELRLSHHTTQHNTYTCSLTSSRVGTKEESSGISWYPEAVVSMLVGGTKTSST